jgi:hypothetical protein
MKVATSVGAESCRSGFARDQLPVLGERELIASKLVPTTIAAEPIAVQLIAVYGCAAGSWPR